MKKMSMSSYLLQRLLAVFLLFCLSKASGGTCLSYGHSCWGGHGKRSGTAHMIGPSSQKHTSGWFISKLLDPPAADPRIIEGIFKNKNLDSEEVVVENFRQSGYQSYPGSNAEKDTRHERGNLENDLKNNKWDSEVGESDEEIMVLTPEIQRVPISKIRLFPMMNQEEGKSRSEY